MLVTNITLQYAMNSPGRSSGTSWEKVDTYNMNENCYYIICTLTVSNFGDGKAWQWQKYDPQTQKQEVAVRGRVPPNTRMND